MTDEIRVISADLDGAELRREKAKNRYHARCDGKSDNEQINDGLKHLGRAQFSIPGHIWERIFGGNNGNGR